MAMVVRLLVSLFIALALFEMSYATVVICDPAVADQSITVGPNERVVYTSKNFPLSFPQGVCGVSFYPATPNTKLVIFFEYFRTYIDDRLYFYANDSNSGPDSQPFLEVVDSIGGDFFQSDFHFPRDRGGPNRFYTGIIMTKFNASSNKIAPGFIAHVIGYDTSKPLACESNTVSLRAGESYMALTPGAIFNTDIVTSCSWSVKPADASTLLRAIVNFANLPHGQVLVSTNGQPTVNITGEIISSFQPRLVFNSTTIANQIDFKMNNLGGQVPDARFVSYIFVVQAFTAQPALSNCPQTGQTLDLVNNGANVMKPFYIETQANFAANFYANNQHCSWSATVSDPTKYVIASYVHTNQLEECCDTVMTTTNNGQSWTRRIDSTDYPNQQKLTVKFDSDQVRTELGLRLELRAVPLFDANHKDGVPIALPANAVEVNVQNPGYGFAIPGGLDLKYTFMAPTGTWVRFRLSNEYARLAIVTGSTVTLYDGASLNSRVIATINTTFLYTDPDNFNFVFMNFFSTQQYLTARLQTSGSYVQLNYAGIQLSAAGVTNHDQVLPNWNQVCTPQGKCFALFYGSDMDNWYAAQHQCRQTFSGGSLVSLHSGFDQSVIVQFLSLSAVTSNLWLGASRASPNDPFLWIDGSAVDYTNYLPGGTAPGQGDCIQVCKDNTAGCRTGFWRAAQCYIAAQSVCEYRQQSI